MKINKIIGLICSVALMGGIALFVACTKENTSETNTNSITSKAAGTIELKAKYSDTGYSKMTITDKSGGVLVVDVTPYKPSLGEDINYLSYISDDIEYKTETDKTGALIATLSDNNLAPYWVIPFDPNEKPLMLPTGGVGNTVRYECHCDDGSSQAKGCRVTWDASNWVVCARNSPCSKNCLLRTIIVRHAFENTSCALIKANKVIFNGN